MEDEDTMFVADEPFGDSYPTTADSAGESKESEKPPVPEWAVPVRRSDAVGLMAWQLVEGDLSVLPALVDALREDNDLPTAMRLKRGVPMLIQHLHRCLRSPRPRPSLVLQDALERVSSQVPHLLYDFNSAVSVLVAATAGKDVKQVVVLDTELPDGSQIVRAQIEDAWVGRRVALEDGRRGTVLTESDETGMARILIPKGGV